MDIAQNLQVLKRRITEAAHRAGRSPDEITLIAVTKGLTAQVVEDALKAGIRHVGENRVQEAMEKIGYLSTLQPHPTWHMIGHLQTNKVKTAVEIFDIIHSIDSLRLAQALSGRAKKTIPVLLQVNIAQEEPKSGYSEIELSKAMVEINHLPGLEIKGLMTIAPLVSNPEEVRPIFRRLRELRDSLGLEHLSMGMSDDFEVAVEEGATMLRIGRAIFAEQR
ncbi:MAG: YggS family pyridoxal phosphate-dependent enzyme [Dehalococcoidia bacterium]|nr:YggS family pyridoxal phosphate-dependent enzyme [Dehalococcoidia bacterium]